MDAATNLSVVKGAGYYGKANSYIVSNAGNYYFDTSAAGNGNYGATDWHSIGFDEDEDEAYPTGGGASLSGNGVEVILIQNSCVSDVIFSSNRIYFKASGNKGNAKLTLTNNGVRVWTWHIWCTDQPATYSINGYTVMDRNLGAYDEIKYTSEQGCGLYYPYGSPFGFTVAEYSAGVLGNDKTYMKDYILHPERPNLTLTTLPMIFNPYNANNAVDVWARIWGNGAAKTMYDPCPDGYKVAPYSFWNGITFTSADYYGMYSGSCFFPFNGKIYKGGFKTQDIVLGVTNHPNITTRGYRTYMWSSSGYVSDVKKAWRYHVRKSAGGDSPTWATDDGPGGLNVEELNLGMGVRCVVGS